MTSKPKSPSKPTISDPDDLISSVRASLGDRLAYLSRLAERLEKKLTRAKTYERNDASHHAWITKQISQIAESVSKNDAREVREADRLPPALVLLHLRRLPDERKEFYLRELAAMLNGEKRSVLG